MVKLMQPNKVISKTSTQVVSSTIQPISETSNPLYVTSPIQTRTRTRQLYIATISQNTQSLQDITPESSIEIHSGSQSITTEPTQIQQPHFDIHTLSPTTSPQLRNIESNMETHDSSAESATDERRFIYLGPTVPIAEMQQQIEELRAQVRYLTSTRSNNSKAIPPVTTPTAPPVISIVSRKPAFPAPQPRTYTDNEKLRGRENYVSWQRMMLRELRMANLLPFVESPLGVATKWTEITCNQGDALAQKVLLQAVTSTVDAQIQFCKTAYDMWSYLKYAYENRTVQQLNSVVREVHHIESESCNSVYKILDKLVALRTASIELGEVLPENYWVTEATRLICELYPRETCEALQHPQCTLLTMRQHFAAFIREATHFQSTIFGKPNVSSSSAITEQWQTQSLTIPIAPLQSSPNVSSSPSGPVSMYNLNMLTANLTPSPQLQYSASTFNPRVPQTQQIVHPTPGSFATTKLSPFKTRVYNSQAYHQRMLRQLQGPSENQQTQFTSTPLPQFASQVPPILHPSQVPVIEQPRYPPPGTYWQTLPNANRRVCYSGHRAEFCPNFNLPVCYGCKGIGHKRPQCPLAWMSAEQSFQQPLVNPATVRPSILPAALQPPLPLPTPKTSGKLFAFNLDKPISSPLPTLYILWGMGQYL